MSGFLRFTAFVFVALSLSSRLAFAAEGAIQPTNWNAVLIFLAFVLVTLGITYWAAQHTRTTKDFEGMLPPRVPREVGLEQGLTGPGDARRALRGAMGAFRRGRAVRAETGRSDIYRIEDSVV